MVSIYLTLGFNDTDSRHGLSACPNFAVHRPSTFDLAFDLVFAYVSMCLLSLTTVGPACPTTWRSPIRGAIGFCSRCALYAFWYLSPPLPAASFRLGCRTVVILCLRVCLVCVFLLSITADCARLFFVQATEPWRYRIFWIRSACTPPSATADSVCLHSFRLSNRGYIVILVAFVPYLIYPPRNW